MEEYVIKCAKEEAQRFIARVNDYLARLKQDKTISYSASREAAAMKRASMDLSRVLTKVRRP